MKTNKSTEMKKKSIDARKKTVTLIKTLVVSKIIHLSTSQPSLPSPPPPNFYGTKNKASKIKKTVARKPYK